MKKSKESPRKLPVWHPEDEDLDLFCKLEKVIHEENDSMLDISMQQRESERSRLAQEFPSCFVNPDDASQMKIDEVSHDQMSEYNKLYNELLAKIAYVNRKKEEVDRNASFIAKERREIERERARIEKDKVIAAANLADIELLELRKKYEALKNVYEQEKLEWEEEKQKLLAQIHTKEDSIHVKFEDQVPKITQKPQSETSRASAPAARPQLHSGYQLDFSFSPGQILREEPRSDGRKLVKYKNGMSATKFRNGTIKMKHGDLIYVFYENGDTAIEFKDGARGYKYSETDTIELNLPDKSVLYQFPNKQIEKHFPNGDKAVQYPNGQFKVLHPNGDYEVHHPSGKVETCRNGHLVITFDE